MQQGKYPAAKVSLNTALKLDPQNPYALFNLGTINEREGNIDQAIIYYQMILDMSSSRASANASNSRKVDSALAQTCEENISRLQKGRAPSGASHHQNEQDFPETP
jgi:cytochrome c-type biogenesis protein CcmH/NrfG